MPRSAHSPAARPSRQLISRTKAALFLECPRCFWLDVVKGIRRPPSLQWTLNNRVDALFKNEFDACRAEGTLPTYLQAPRPGMRPANHPHLDRWRKQFNGVRRIDAATGIECQGIIDDLWVDDENLHYVVDYKATSKESLGDLYESYRFQADFYAWLLQGQGLQVADTAFFVYANASRSQQIFDQKLVFDVTIVEHTCNAARIPGVIANLAQVLRQPQAPDPAAECKHCQFVAAIASLPSSQETADA